MGNKGEKFMNEEAEHIDNFLYVNDQVGLRKYILENRLRLSEPLENGESILEISLNYWNSFENLVTWYHELNPSFRFDQYHNKQGVSMFYLAYRYRAHKKFLALFVKLFGKDRFYELTVGRHRSVFEFFKKFPTGFNDEGYDGLGDQHSYHLLGDLHYELVKFILRNIPFNQHKIIELIGESNVDIELLDYYNSDVWFKQEKTGLVYVNHFQWSKAISKNLMLEILEILKPKPLASKLEEKKGSVIIQPGVYSEDENLYGRIQDELEIKAPTEGGNYTRCEYCGKRYDVSCIHRCLAEAKGRSFLDELL